MKQQVIMVIFVLALLAACFSPWAGDETTITVNLGSNSGFGRLLVYPPGGTNILNQLKYNVLFSGSGNAKTLTVTGGTIIKTTLSPGIWDIKIDAYLNGSFLYARGLGRTEVKSGKNNFAEISMTKAFYEIGDAGPGSGLIFHVDTMGFLNTYTGTICHYLEAAADDEIGSGVPAAIPWGITDTGYVTDVAIGSGRKNTANIIEILQSQPVTNIYAARLCAAATYGGKSDWFLPSYDELVKMYENLYMLGYGTFPGGTILYWSSTCNIGFMEAWGFNFNSGSQAHDWMTSARYTRAIRAF